MKYREKRLGYIVSRRAEQLETRFLLLKSMIFLLAYGMVMTLLMATLRY